MPYTTTDDTDVFRLEVNASYIYRMLRSHGGLTFVFKNVDAASQWAAHIEERAVHYFALQIDLSIPAREAKKELDALGTFYNMCRIETLAYLLEYPELLDETVGLSESPRKNREIFG